MKILPEVWSLRSSVIVAICVSVCIVLCGTGADAKPKDVEKSTAKLVNEYCDEDTETARQPIILKLLASYRPDILQKSVKKNLRGKKTRGHALRLARNLRVPGVAEDAWKYHIDYPDVALPIVFTSTDIKLLKRVFAKWKRLPTESKSEGAISFGQLSTYFKESRLPIECAEWFYDEAIKSKGELIRTTEARDVCLAIIGGTEIEWGEIERNWKAKWLKYVKYGRASGDDGYDLGIVGIQEVGKQFNRVGLNYRIGSSSVDNTISNDCRITCDFQSMPSYMTTAQNFDLVVNVMCTSAENSNIKVCASIPGKKGEPNNYPVNGTNKWAYSLEGQAKFTKPLVKGKWYKIRYQFRAVKAGAEEFKLRVMVNEEMVHEGFFRTQRPKQIYIEASNDIAVSCFSFELH